MWVYFFKHGKAFWGFWIETEIQVNSNVRKLVLRNISLEKAIKGEKCLIIEHQALKQASVGFKQVWNIKCGLHKSGF